jgi:hypothetical protein
VTRVPAIALLTALLLLGGCLSGPAPGTDSTTATASPAPDTDCDYTLSVQEATDDQIERTDSTIAYANLSDARRTEFDRALENGTYGLGVLFDTSSRPRIVEKGGEQYYAVSYTC